MRSNEKICELYIRNKWIILVFLIPFFSVTSFYNVNSKLLLVTGAVFVSYCIWGKKILFNKKKNIDTFKKVMPYVDTLFCGAVIFLRGGLRSDAFMFFIFLIVFYSVFEKNKTCLRICLLSMLIYTLSCMYYVDSVSTFFWERFIIRLNLLPVTLIIVAWFNRRLNLAKTTLEREKLGARKDTLTGLWNRKMLDETLIKLASEYKFDSKKKYGILIIDLDDFKSVNDMFGHDKGDFVLENVSHSINLSITHRDMPFRIGGDEFLIIIRDCDEFKLKLYADRIKNSVSRIRFNFGDSLRGITVSIGGSLSSEGDFEKMYKLSDERMYDGKTSGKNVGITC